MSEPTPRRDSGAAPGFRDFELLAFIGKDGDCELYRARQIHLNRLVTLKILDDDVQSLERAGQMRREAEAIHKLDHPNVLGIYETGVHKGMPFLIQPAVDGEPLSERLKFGPLPAKLAAGVARDLAAVLEFAHERGKIHGSLRPEVVWLTNDGHALLGGFGNPTQNDASDLTRNAASVGFTAPEQAGAWGAVGRHTDVYGLGAILFAMVTGAAPFDGPDLDSVLRAIRETDPPLAGEIAHEADSALEAICERCLLKPPAQRYGPDKPMTRLHADLKRYLQGKPVRAATESVTSGLRRSLRRHISTVVALALVLGCVALGALWDRTRTRMAWRTLLTADATLQEHDRAFRLVQRARLDRPGDAEWYAAAALGHIRLGRYDAALKTADQAPRQEAWTDTWLALRRLAIRPTAASPRNKWPTAANVLPGTWPAEVAALLRMEVERGK